MTERYLIHNREFRKPIDIWDAAYRAGLERAAEIVKDEVSSAALRDLMEEIAKHAADELAALSQEMKLDY